MSYFLKGIYACLLIFIAYPAAAKRIDHLANCEQKLTAGLKSQMLQLQYTQVMHQFYHSPRPWQTYARKTNDIIWMNTGFFACIDTINGRQGKLFSKIQYTESYLLEQDYGDTVLSPVTEKEFRGELLDIARYNPLLLVHYFHDKQASISGEGQLKLYKLHINNKIVTLCIDSRTDLLQSTRILEDHDMYGDVLTTITYQDYKNVNKLWVPTLVTIHKINEHAIDTILLTDANVVEPIGEVLQCPAGYRWQDEKVKSTVIKTIAYNDHISLVQLDNSSSQCMVVSFRDFCMVIDAPLNSKNGEALLQEVRKIAAGKPVRYFTFGHHHPWSLGGVRPFISAHTTVISLPEDTAYVSYIASNPHSLSADQLEQNHIAPVYTLFADSLSISDSSYELRMYHMGKRSAHTDDYVIYYFPAEKLVFEDDLAAVRSSGKISKASERQAGLYYEIKDRRLDVDTVIQSWPTAGYDLKSQFSFAELEQSATMQ